MWLNKKTAMLLKLFSPQTEQKRRNKILKLLGKSSTKKDQSLLIASFQICPQKK